MSSSKTKVFDGLTLASLSNLKTFGDNLRIAIKRRGKRQQDIADAVFISLPTLRNVLKGDPKVAFGTYLAVLAQLQLDEEISTLADPKNDEIGIALAERNLPSRVRVKEDKYEF